MGIIPPVPYPALERHGLIGDRRSAALVAADGTLDWMCLPDFSGGVVFGTLLDAGAGGHWRMGPACLTLGKQDYPDDTAVLVTTWETNSGRLELADAMAGPGGDGKPTDGPRAVLRRLRCTKGQVRCVCDFVPRWEFQPCEAADSTDGGPCWRVGAFFLRLWVNRPVETDATGARASFDLREGEEFWAVLDLGGRGEPWTTGQAQKSQAEAAAYWERWSKALKCTGPRARQVGRSALLVDLLTFAPQGSVVAAPTTSLPERLGGGWNADYRFSWVRDASLALAVLALVGQTETGGRYLEWLGRRAEAAGGPWQVVYGLRGETALPQEDRRNLYGYRGSLPVRFGNHAWKQRQHDVVGFLIDCVHIHLQQGGKEHAGFWKLVRRAADHVATHWRESGSGIWELSAEQHYLSGRVMSWVALDRALRVAERMGEKDGSRDRWRQEREAIYQDVMEHGWSEKLGAFRQCYEGDNLDAAALLIPLMGMLPPDHPRVAATVERILDRLSIDGFVYRFVPAETKGMGDQPLGEYEGAFLPCTFWMATVLARMGRTAEAESILRRAEAIAGPPGLFAEGVDTRTSTFLGNHPLMFSQAEYVRAVLALNEARGGKASGA